MKPINASNLKSIKEIFSLLYEFDNQNLKLVFVFSERASFIHQILVKYYLIDKITFVSDHQLNIFDKFNISNLYVSETGCYQRESKIILLKNNQIEKELTYHFDLP
jgi:hypothetical protein